MKFTAHASPDLAGGGWTLQGSVEDEEATPRLIALANWLRALDPEEVERVALERCSGLGGSATADIIEVLAEWAEGSP